MTTTADQQAATYPTAIAFCMTAALWFAGAVSFDDGLRLTRLRGELMYEAGLARPGTMAAVLGLSDEAIEDDLSRFVGEVGFADDRTTVLIRRQPG